MGRTRTSSIVIGITMVRDEADIIGATVRHMLDEVDTVIVADNLSTDMTTEVLAGIQREHGDDRVCLVGDPVPAYEQSRKMTDLAHLAHLHGADWIVPFDADEWWYSPFGRIADVLDDLAEQWLVVPATLYDHVATGLDPNVSDPTMRIGWRRLDPAPLPKVACRWREDLVIDQGNHGATYTGGATIWPPGLLVVRHFPYRSVDQLVRKVRNGAAAYAAAGDRVPADAGAHWRQWGEILEHDGPDAIGDLFRKWYWRGDPQRAITIEGEQQPPLIFDPVTALPRP